MANQSDIFKALREKRQGTSVNEENQGKMNEEAEDKKSTTASVDEETVLACPHCGIIGSVLDESVAECPFCGEEELVEKVVKVVRDGKVVKKNKPTKKKRLTAAQKQALAKARKKAHTASANKSRSKSMKVRKRTMNDSDTYECPECGFSGEYEDFDEEDGILFCPECGTQVDLEEKCSGAKKNSKGKKKMNEEADDLRSLLESVNASEYMFTFLDKGNTAAVKRYLDLKMEE